MPPDWSRIEVEAIVSDYFEMLAMEISGQEFSKADHNRELRTHVPRERGSIEFKHQNISAVLRDLGHPWIDGYKPRGNYQSLLYDVVCARLANDEALRRTVEADVTNAAVVPSVIDLLSRLEIPPAREPTETSPEEETTRAGPPPRFVNYLSREASNASLGRAGEEFVLRFERMRLISQGRDGLAERIEHVAATQGDGTGFDIRSFEENGRDRLIEVKTTRTARALPSSSLATRSPSPAATRPSTASTGSSSFAETRVSSRSPAPSTRSASSRPCSLRRAWRSRHTRTITRAGRLTSFVRLHAIARTFPAGTYRR